jgi:RNA polymerase primary sigma factor
MLHDIDDRGDHSVAVQIGRASRALRQAIRALVSGSQRRVRASAKALAAARFESQALEALLHDLGCDAQRSTARLLHRGRRISESAKQRLVESAARLVVSVARHYLRPGVDLLDLIQDGNLALLRAVDKFDARRGFRFATYALYWVRVAIFRSATEQGQTIRAPALVNQDSSTVARSRRRLSQSLGRDPADEEVASELGWTVRRVGMASSTVFRTVSLDLPIGEDGDGCIADLIADPDGRSPLDHAIVGDRASEAHALLGSLPERHAMVLRQRFGIGDGSPKTLEEISATLGITREGVRQVELKALARIRQRTSNQRRDDMIDG